MRRGRGGGSRRRRSTSIQTPFTGALHPVNKHSPAIKFIQIIDFYQNSKNWVKSISHKSSICQTVSSYRPYIVVDYGLLKGYVCLLANFGPILFGIYLTHNFVLVQQIFHGPKIISFLAMSKYWTLINNDHQQALATAAEE